MSYNVHVPHNRRQAAPQCTIRELDLLADRNAHITMPGAPSDTRSRANVCVGARRAGMRHACPLARRRTCKNAAISAFLSRFILMYLSAYF